ncbi:MAG: MBL fold metallo-hydrolase [Planctomycetales bacterium]|nr:MBL fold metallo-hydrolase [Planctomycetales bacterium]
MSDNFERRNVADCSQETPEPVPWQPPCDAQFATHRVVREAPAYRRRIVRMGRTFVAVDYGLSNAAMVLVDGGYVVIDTCSSLAEAEHVKQDLAAHVQGDCQAVIYTHFHHDHIAGVAAFHQPGVPIWAHELFHDEFRYVLSFPRFYHQRAARQFGYALSPEQVVTNGIGPPLQIERGSMPTLLMPDNTFSQNQRLEIGGTTFEMVHAPGESLDQIFVWLPEDRILFAADNFYKAFPNLYAIRGGKPRPVQGWIDSLDAMRRLDPAPEYLVLGHTEPLQGAAQICTLLTEYRDGIAFVHDSVVRGINAGKTMDELVREIRLPPQLVDHPYLQPKYGTLTGGIRGIYTGYVGWFDGNPSHLEPLNDVELGQRVTSMIGGRSAVIQAARQALDDRDPQWANWLCDQLLAQDPRDRDAARTKAISLETLAADTPNPLFRNWYLTDAALLRRDITMPRRAPLNSRTVQDIPIREILRRFPQRIDLRRAARLKLRVGFDFTDTNQHFTFVIRNGVGELVEGILADPDFILRMTETDFRRSVCQELKPISREYLQKVQCEAPGSPLLSPFRRLYRGLQFARCLQLP